MHGKGACSWSEKVFTLVAHASLFNTKIVSNGSSACTCTYLYLARSCGEESSLSPGEGNRCPVGKETLSSTWRQSLSSIWSEYHVAQIRHLQELHLQCIMDPTESEIMHVKKGREAAVVIGDPEEGNNEE